MLQFDGSVVPVVFPGYIPGGIPPVWPPKNEKDDKHGPERSPGHYPPGGTHDDGDGGGTIN